MRARGFILVAGLLLVLVGGAVGVYVYDQGQRSVIAKGVSVAGVDVGGLHESQARARLSHRFLASLRHPVVVTHGARRYTLTPREARLRVDIDGSVAEGLARSRDGSIFARVERGIGGGRLDANLQPRIVYSHAAVDRLVRRVGDSLDRAPRNASVSFAAAGLGEVPGHTGLAVDRRRLSTEVQAALLRRGASARRVRVRTRVLRPRITTSQLSRRYPTVVTIDRANFTLRLFKHLKMAKSYPIAVGRQGLETPSGLYPVQDKQIDPVWHVPNSSWAGSLAGQTIPPGPQDPLKARWIGITGGAGIHGTAETGSLGSAASHGCIRMAIPDVIELFGRVPYGSLIYIA